MSKIVSIKNLGSVLNEIISNTPVFDIHTHLFPETHEGYFLSGIDQILTYHYLTTEVLAATSLDPDEFFSKPLEKQAECVWDELFIRRTPISEAARGVVTLLNAFNIQNKKISYDELKTSYIKAHNNNTERQVLELSGVKKLIMTNDPFNEKEWSLFKKRDWDKNIYLSSIRIDKLFENRKKDLSKFLEIKIKESKAKMFSSSLDGGGLLKLLVEKDFTDVVMPLLAKNKMPLAIMFGVKRQVNPRLQSGGDGMSTSNIDSIEFLVKRFPGNKFLISTMNENDHHAAVVLSRKFSNLKLFGFWWFSNIPSVIEKQLRMRFELLGFNFIGQYSDARVMEHLIYKWMHYKKILFDVLLGCYNELLNNNWPLSRDDIERDVYMHLYGNAEDIVEK